MENPLINHFLQAITLTETENGFITQAKEIVIKNAVSTFK